MMNQQYIELMNQELDGVNSPGQSRELAQYLESDEKARQYFQELQDALQIFQKVDMLEPPRGLTESIDVAVAAVDRTRAVHRIPQTPRSSWREFFRPARVVTFATGAMFSLIVFAGLTQFNPGTGDGRSAWIRGTATTINDTAGGHRSTGLFIDLPGVTGQVSVLDRDPGTLLRLELTTAEPVSVRLKYGESLTFDGYHAAHAEKYSLTTYLQMTALEHHGDGDYYFLFSHPEGSDAVIEVEVQTAGGQRVTLPVHSGD